MNRSNAKFYENFPVGDLNKSFAKIAGLEDAFELNHPRLKRIIDSSNSIMEIGAGEGRIIEGLIAQNYRGHIYAIDRNQNFLDHLKKQHSTNKKIHIVYADILEDELPSVDVGLFLWSGILEFSKEEQGKLISKLSKYCKQLIIDSPTLEAKTNATSQNNKELTLKTEFGIIKGRIPSSVEIQFWSEKKYEYFEEIKYKTSNGRERVFYLLS